MRIISLLIISFLFSSLTAAQDIELLELKNRYAEWIQAWNEKDSKTVAEISWGNYGFGRDVPFMRSGASDIKIYEKGIKSYMDSMLIIDYKEYYTDYKIIDSVGLINGFYAQTTQQNNGLKRTVYGRQSLVFIKRSGNWKMIHYHRSTLPNEFIR